MNIKLVYSNTKTYNGIKAYSLNLFKDMLLEPTMKVDLKPLPKVEFSFNGKKYGGWTSQRFMAWTVGNAEIVHSTTHWDLSSHTNVVTIHDLYPLVERKQFGTSNRAANFYLRMLKKVREKSKYIVVQGKHIEDQVRKYIPDTPIAVIPTRVFVDQPTYNPYPNDDKTHLITMGEIHGNLPNRKQIYELYDWVKDLKDVDLYHIGRITDPRYLNYSPNIHQLGSVSQEDKFNYLACADKFVFKSMGEGQGIPSMEAMKLNTQVIVNDLPEFRNFLGDKPYYFHNKDEFLEMINLPKKPGLVEQISQYDNWVEKYKMVYNEVVK